MGDSKIFYIEKENKMNSWNLSISRKQNLKQKIVYNSNNSNYNVIEIQLPVTAEKRYKLKTTFKV